MKKKLLTWTLVLALLLPSFAACSESGTNSDETAPAGSSDTPADVAATPEEEEPEMGLETAKLLYADRDYGGYNYRIADRATGDWLTFDVYAEV